MFRKDSVAVSIDPDPVKQLKGALSDSSLQRTGRNDKSLIVFLDDDSPVRRDGIPPDFVSELEGIDSSFSGAETVREIDEDPFQAVIRPVGCHGKLGGHLLSRGGQEAKMLQVIDPA